MKKFIIIFSFVLLIMLVNMNTVSVMAEAKNFKQGIYYVLDAKLVINSPYRVKNISSTNDSLLMVVNSNLMIQEFVRFEPNSPEYSIRPFSYDDMIVVLGEGELVFI